MSPRLGGGQPSRSAVVRMVVSRIRKVRIAALLMRGRVTATLTRRLARWGR